MSNIESREEEAPCKLDSKEEKCSRWVMVLSLCLFAAALAHYLWSVSVGWDHYVTDRYEFRQAQCAISIYHMVKGPFKLAYDTPVLGTPWAIPFEFPLYQWIVAAIVRGSGTSIEQAGRFVSVFFYLLCLVPSYFALGSMGMAARHRWAVLSLLLISPFYTFWSRTIMIETTALFFGLCYIALAFRALSKPSGWTLGWAAACGVLVALVKATTLPAFGVAIFLYALRDYWKKPGQWPDRWTVLRHWGRVALLGIIPVLAAALWTHYTDSVRGANPIGVLLSSKALTKWNYGTIEQKTSLQTWQTIGARIPTLFSASAVCWTFLLLAAGVMLPLVRRRWKETLACVVLFFSAPVIFTNLHWVHEYYMCANGVFLLAAVGFVLAGLFETPKGEWAGLGAAALLLIAGHLEFQNTFAPMQSSNNGYFLPLAQHVKKETKPDDVIIFLGYSWSSVLPFYCERRALMIPEFTYKNGKAIRKAFKNLRGQQVGLIIVNPLKVPDSQLEYFQALMKWSDVKAQGVFRFDSL